MDHALALGFAIGLIVGEGTFTRHRIPALVVELLDDPEPLARAQSVLGGVIYGPYLLTKPMAGVPKPYYKWQLVGPALRRALPLLEALIPPSRKRQQFDAWRARHAQQLALPPVDMRNGRKVSPAECEVES